uniref:Uncharacterized protein n=1 Tax=Tanacetum cinerariifolium TaxID=118510 RepID=A0A699H0H7_TANCI|nr:hypothetical protein [Tanacetum cinerariifolium]
MRVEVEDRNYEPVPAIHKGLGEDMFGYGRSQVRVPPGTFTSLDEIEGSTGGFKIHLPSVVDQSCSGVVFNRFMGKFKCSSSSQAPDKTAKQKEKSSFDAATVANKEAAAYSMVSKQPVQDQFRVPSLVTSDSLELFESSSRFAKRKRTPIEDSRTSQVPPDTKPIATTIGGAPQCQQMGVLNLLPGDIKAGMLIVFQSPICSSSVTARKSAHKHTRRRKKFVVIGINTDFSSKRRRNSVRET